MIRNILCIIFLLVLTPTVIGEEKKVSPVEAIENASVNLKAGSSEGSGIIITREIIMDDQSKKKINFVLTAGHVIDSLRKVREVIDVKGQTRKVIDFDDAFIVKEFRQEGRRIGETKLDCKIIKYSEANNGEDIAVMMVRRYDLGDFSNVEFYLNSDITPIGTDLLHVGSLLGQMGANSLTKGVMSQIGRVFQGKTYDQTTVPAFPGSSGGGVFRVDNDKALYIGMVTRGSGETFNLIVPIRRILIWAKDNNVEWIFNPAVNPPTMQEILKLPIEATLSDASEEKDKKELKFLIKNSE